MICRSWEGGHVMWFLVQWDVHKEKNVEQRIPNLHSQSAMGDRVYIIINERVSGFKGVSGSEVDVCSEDAFWVSVVGVNQGTLYIFEWPCPAAFCIQFLDGTRVTLGEGCCSKDGAAVAVPERCVMGEEGDWLLLLGDLKFLCHVLSGSISRQDENPGMFSACYFIGTAWSCSGSKLQPSIICACWDTCS